MLRQFVFGGEDGHMKNHPDYPMVRSELREEGAGAWPEALDGHARALLLHHAQPPSIPYLISIAWRCQGNGMDKYMYSQIPYPYPPLACTYRARIYSPTCYCSLCLSPVQTTVGIEKVVYCTSVQNYLKIFTEPYIVFIEKVVLLYGSFESGKIFIIIIIKDNN
jgi:hypothetical protein